MQGPLPPPLMPNPMQRGEDTPEAEEALDVRCYWELEEAEDDCTQHTLVHLIPDGTVDLGQTDGPVPSTSRGAWKHEPSTGALEVRITRRFDDVRFPYEVERVYAGVIERDGPVAFVEGPIAIEDAGITVPHTHPPERTGNLTLRHANPSRRRARANHCRLLFSLHGSRLPRR